MANSNQTISIPWVLVTSEVWLWPHTGIGLETARDLASRGARVILACRNISKGNSALQDIQQTTGNKKLAVKKLDLSSMESVRQFAGDIIQNEKR